MKLFGGNKYNDDQLANQSMTAIANDPLISDSGRMVVTSKNGVVTISGSVRNQQEKERIEGVVRNALTTMGLKHEQIANELRLPQTVG
jgi:osmotically-inducible protein OsmY